MRLARRIVGTALAVISALAFGAARGSAREVATRGATSHAPVAGTGSFESVVERMTAAKAAVVAQHEKLLDDRYDLADRSAPGASMSRGKALQDGVRVKLHGGVTWGDLATLTPEQTRQRDLWPKGFLPRPHPHHAEGGMLFPRYHIDEVKRQTGLLEDQADRTREDGPRRVPADALARLFMNP
ncbi:MAG: hypothetical protein CMJ83_06155 [Planctomycetes bacterium]|nr:hypothetical protein [Planctomycetota bacterium]